MDSNNKTKILHIATIDAGGSFNAAKRLNEMLCKKGFDSKILVRTKTQSQSQVTEAFDSKMDELISKARNVINLCMKKGEVKRDILGADIRENELVKEADIIVIHWISTFLSPKELWQLSELNNKRVIFVMHDMWLFTGGCHVDRRCGGYQTECRSCPLAGRYAHVSFERKRKYIQKADMTFTGPSRWIVEEAGKSSILSNKRIVYMPNVYNSDIFFKPLNRTEIRHELGIAEDRHVILIGAADAGINNSNKGFNYLLEALGKIDTTKVTIAIIGNSNGSDDSLKAYDVMYLGYVSDEEKLAQIYAAADVFVNPSLQESFGYTVCEAMACGTPCVAFAVGGMLDQIESEENGYLAKFCDSSSLAAGIEYVLANRDRLSEKAAATARRFSYEKADSAVLEVLLQ